MFTSKQRSNLRSLAQNIAPVTQVGKGGISENLIKSLSDALDARELIKISVLNNAESDAREIAEELAAALNAETVEVIGKKVVLYRKSARKDVKHIKF
ncbi:MAG: ribosome assembly RNA-binding protein YhbY [Candidatus Borkfalkiaceae bacterium]|nr:ribosome assembly RNA-binding protein YhbY [Christensenellaceae bacterium]